MVGADAGGLARVVGSIGLAGVVTCAASRGVRLYRAGMTASLPTSVGREFVCAHPPRVFSAITLALALGWISRLSVLVSSRAREFSADAAAATSPAGRALSPPPC